MGGPVVSVGRLLSTLLCTLTPPPHLQGTQYLQVPGPSALGNLSVLMQTLRSAPSTVKSLLPMHLAETDISCP